MIDPDVVITLYDVWVLTGKKIWEDRLVASWTPVDHYPVPPKVAEWCQTRKTIAMSQFGKRALADLGIDSTYIPHGIENVFQPTPGDIRTRLNVPDDAFLVMINAANIGNAPIPRKAWDVNIQAMASFARDHENVYLYIHSDVRRPGGVPLDGLIEFWGMPRERVRVPEQTVYRMGAVDQKELAELYTTANVLLAVSHGEGFGVPTVEAMLCETPAIVSDFSAQPELVGDTGWKVSGQLFYDQGQHSAWIMPYVFSIRAALEEAYKEHGTTAASARRRQAREHALQYDADHVYDLHWKPYIELLARSAKNPRKKHSPPHPVGNRASRRAKR
jgi:glycosyltransferase involved in cell wall biosynthesis